MYVCHYCHGYAYHLDGLTSYFLLNPSTELDQKGATRGQRKFKLFIFSLLKKHDVDMPHANMPRTDIW